jgi:hypothetical protein
VNKAVGSIATLHVPAMPRSFMQRQLFQRQDPYKYLGRQFLVSGQIVKKEIQATKKGDEKVCLHVLCDIKDAKWIHKDLGEEWAKKEISSVAIPPACAKMTLQVKNPFLVTEYSSRDMEPQLVLKIDVSECKTLAQELDLVQIAAYPGPVYMMPQWDQNKLLMGMTVRAKAVKILESHAAVPMSEDEIIPKI